MGAGPLLGGGGDAKMVLVFIQGKLVEDSARNLAFGLVFNAVL